MGSDNCLKGRNMLGQMVSCQRHHICGDTLAMAAAEPLDVDLSDYGDEFVAGYLAGQVNAMEWLQEGQADDEAEEAYRLGPEGDPYNAVCLTFRGPLVATGEESKGEGE